MNISGESTSFATGVPGQDGADKPQKGSGAKFANIQSYLDANQSQGESMGSQIASGVEQKAQDAQGKISSFQSAAPKIDAYDPNEAYSKINDGSFSDADKQKYNSAKAGYSGPQQLDQVSGYGDAQKSTMEASQKVSNAGTEQGQRELLKETYKRPSYTAGENALDQTIVQSNPNSKSKYEQLGQKYGELSSLFDSTAKNVGDSVNSAIGTGFSNQKAIAEGDAKAMSALMDPIKARAAEQTAQNTDKINRYGSDIQDETLNDETLAALGLSEGQNLWDLNLSNYFNPNYTQVGINNAANSDERRKYSLLTDLISGKAGSEITADGQAINPYGFDKARLDADIAKKQKEFEEFSKSRNYYGRSGQNNYDWGDYFWNPDFEASANLSNYLSSGNQINTNSLGQDLSRFQDGAEISSPFIEAAKKQVRDQIEADLAKYNYNRRIKKG